MRNMWFTTLVSDAGWCCAHGCLTVSALKAQKTRIGRLVPSTITKQWGYTLNGSENILRRWREGRYVCEKKKKCILEKMGLKEVEVPNLSEKRKTFLALKGEQFVAYPSESVPVRKGVGVKCTVTSQSMLDWLWISVTFDEDDTTPKLGDQIWLDNVIWGTVVDIEGRHITLLLPGVHHGSRIKSAS